MEEQGNTRITQLRKPETHDTVSRLRREVALLRMERARLEADMDALRTRLQDALDLGMDLARQRNTYIEHFARSEAERRTLLRERDLPRPRPLATPNRAATLRQPPMRAANGELFDSGELLAVATPPTHQRRREHPLTPLSLHTLRSRIDELAHPPDRGAACVPVLDSELDPLELDAPSNDHHDDLAALLWDLEPVRTRTGC
jgi:hypothetical protein